MFQNSLRCDWVLVHSEEVYAFERHVQLGLVQHHYKSRSYMTSMWYMGVFQALNADHCKIPMPNKLSSELH